MGGKSGGSQTMEVNEYRMSIHYGICSGPVDAIQEILVDEKTAWSGNVTSQGAIGVNKPNLFGGEKKEGGSVGTAYFLPGGPSQTLPAAIASRFGLTEATCPAFRGLASLFMYNGGSGFTWKSNVPYLPGVWVKVLRRSRGLNSANALIGGDSNPAHIIYECLTNTDWGMGAPSTLIDVDSFTAAAAVLYAEDFGLSMIWTRQSSIEDFITEVLDHILATFYVNPTTGLMTIKLIRDDYDIDELPILSPDNCKVTKFQRKLWGETTNEIQVTWTNPTNEQEETVIQQDLANISQQGLISDNRNYYAVRKSSLAVQLAVRDLRSAATPLATVEIDVDRTGWNLLPGGLVKLRYPEHGVYDLVLRLGPVNYGKPGSPTIKITATEDIFTQQEQAYVLPPETGWEDPSEEPAPMAHVTPLTLPAFLVVNSTDVSVSDTTFPEVVVGFLAAQNGNDTISYDLIGETVDVAGNFSMGNLGTRSPLGRAILQSPLAAEATTEVSGFPGATGPINPEVARFVFIGDGSEETTEIALIRSGSETDGWVLERGVLDTTPKAWAPGAPLWFLDMSVDYMDFRLQSVGDSLDYQLLPRTSLGSLAIDDTPIVTVIPTDRPYRPLRPANVKVEDVAFGVLAGAGFGPWDVTWANRNRLTEDSQVLGWSVESVAPEAGQTTTVQVLHATTKAVLTETNGIAGTTFSLERAAFAGNSQGIVRVLSKRDGFKSLQAHEILITGVE